MGAHCGRYKTVIMGVDSYLPQQIVENKDLEKKIDTSDEWIRQRTGIAPQAYRRC